MASSEIHPGPGRFRRGAFGYRRRDVDRYFAELAQLLQAPSDDAGGPDDGPLRLDDIGRHLADILRRFAEAVSAGEQEAAVRAAAMIAEAQVRAEQIEQDARKLLADAQHLSDATLEEARRRYEAVTAAHQVVGEQIEEAIEQLADALTSVRTIPQFPGATTASPVIDAEQAGSSQPPVDPQKPDPATLKSRSQEILELTEQLRNSFDSSVG